MLLCVIWKRTSGIPTSRCNVENAAGPLRPHDRQNSSRHAHQAEKIRFKNFPNRLFAAFLKGGDGTESRIVHQHINAAELLNSSRCSLVVDGLIRIRDVKRQTRSFEQY